MNKLNYWQIYTYPSWRARQLRKIFYAWQKVLVFYYRGKNKNKVSHWFQIESWNCVLCGRANEYRNYMYGKRPKCNGYNVLFIYHDDLCGGHY